MAIINKIGKKINVFAKNAVQKSNEVMEISKLNVNINTEEDGLNDLYRKLGEYCFEKYTNGETKDNTIEEIAKEILIHQENIVYFKEKINEIKNVIVCPACGKENIKTKDICSKCKKPLLVNDAQTEVVTDDVEQSANDTGASESDQNFKE